jgi:hypothetical protein
MREPRVGMAGIGILFTTAAPVSFSLLKSIAQWTVK